MHDAEEELVFGPACWLWDYMRRSGASGYLLSLSGGADSSATATIVGALCQARILSIWNLSIPSFAESCEGMHEWKQARGA